MPHSSFPRMSRREMQILSTGHQDHKVVVFDNFSSQAKEIRNIALETVFEPAYNHYPGLRADLPKDYLDAQIPLIELASEQAFQLAGNIEVIDASFSLVTTRHKDLSVEQRLPHTDDTDPRRLALVHYLFDNGDKGGYDGTGFFRHRSTGFETISDDSKKIYRDQIEAELRIGGTPPVAYVNGDTELHECIFRIPAKFNRAVLYHSNQLHSGLISGETMLSADPSRGRLTITAFFRVK